MPEFSWDHTHIKTYDVPATAAWLQKFLGAANVAGTSVSEARADLMIGGTKVIVTQVKDGDGVDDAPQRGVELRYEAVARTARKPLRASRKIEPDSLDCSSCAAPSRWLRRNELNSAA